MTTYVPFPPLPTLVLSLNFPLLAHVPRSKFKEPNPCLVSFTATSILLLFTALPGDTLLELPHTQVCLVFGSQADGCPLLIARILTLSGLTWEILL